jgi:hypothetical protein
MKTHPNERHCEVEITAIERRVNKFAKIIREKEMERERERERERENFCSDFGR